MNTPQLTDDLLALTKAQTDCVNWDSGALLVLAGPGSGKTRVLTTRIARLLEQSPTGTFRILALTFTNKAADEMSARVFGMVPDQARRALIGTFHSFCMQLLQQHGSHIGINPDFSIYSLQADRQDLLKEALRDNSIDVDDVKVLPIIDKLKAALVLPEGCSALFRDQETGEKVELAYAAYENALNRVNALDFGSLIAQSYKLITTFPGIAARYRKTYRYWLFDEFQDTTEGQYRLIRSLAGDDFKNLFVVADDDQIIYQWNGASYKQIQRFRKDFNPTEIQLPTNYRCPPSIVAVANRLVTHNKERTTGKMPLLSAKTSQTSKVDSSISLHRYNSDQNEAAGIAQAIAAYPRSQWGNIVVLARTRALVQNIKNQLVAHNINAVFAQRQDDFRSPYFIWLNAALRLASHPLDRRSLETLVGAFNRTFNTSQNAEEIQAASQLSSNTFLLEWARITAAANPEVSLFSGLAERLSQNPASYQNIISEFMDSLPADASDENDIQEDTAAWKDLTKSIKRALPEPLPLEKFLQELAMRSKEPPIKANTVTLMTIHGAKGKEFDIVFVAGLAEEVLPSFQSVRAGEKSPQMEEERRNCFVAITRAKELLYLSFADRYNGWPKQPSRFLYEMGILPE
ncbi:ATP-dependent helicase [Thalassospira australica]|uniref:ATP-dependent helicase n=1 Tax=Thalassospira australica TaxID=1528106 RepID=UPI00384C126C